MTFYDEVIHLLLNVSVWWFLFQYLSFEYLVLLEQRILLPEFEILEAKLRAPFEEITRGNRDALEIQFGG
ncbi:hypothetical protein PG997_002010 [Apiospora hydei]|uniref:Uncharacterized protein n=1 Tax=Apiospora hydei TaxID=1337664 RepID=A0ABR1X899_9PEZI